MNTLTPAAARIYSRDECMKELQESNCGHRVAQVAMVAHKRRDLERNLGKSELYSPVIAGPATASATGARLALQSA